MGIGEYWLGLALGGGAVFRGRLASTQRLLGQGREEVQAGRVPLMCLGGMFECSKSRNFVTVSLV